MNHFMQVPIGEMPINLLLLLETRSIAFIRTAQFTAIYDVSGDIDAYFDMQSFSIGEVEYDYNTEYQYKEIPTMLAWLVEQKLILN